MKNYTITIYNKDTRLKASVREAFETLARNAWSYRWLIWRSFMRDFTTPYKQSFLGMGWSFIVPMIPVTAYLVLVFMGVLDARAGMPFLVYLVTGMTLWMFLSGGINSVVNSIQRDRGIITKVKFPLVVVILSGFGKVFSDTLIRAVFVIVSFAIYGIVPKWTILLLPFIILPFVLLSFGIGIIVGLLNVVLADTKNVVDLFLSYGMFICSVFFAMPTTGTLGQINRFNIFNQFIIGVREFLVFGHISDIPGYMAASLLAVIVFALSIKVLYSLEYKIIGHL